MNESRGATSRARAENRPGYGPLIAWSFAVLVSALRQMPAQGPGLEAERPAAAPATGTGRMAPDETSTPDDKSRVAARDGGRGRDSTTPSDIPGRGWKDILWRVYGEFGRDRLTAVAAGVTYFGLLALFPAIAALVSIYGLFAEPATVTTHLDAASGVLPGGALDVIREQVTRIASQGGGTLGVSFAIGLAISLWSANAGMKAIFDALNVVYNEEEKRGFIALNLLSLTFTLGAIVIVLMALAGIVAIPIVLDFVGLGSTLEAVLSLARWPILLAVIVVALAMLYRYGPSRDKAQWRWVTWGGAFAAIAWIAMSMLFSWYVSSFGNYNATYGSLGAVIGFMTWMWLSAMVILLGAEINSEIEHQTAHDTTEGPKRPMGTRGAQVADTVGKAAA